MPDEERLIVALEARVNQFEKNFQKAQRTANDNFAGIERRAKRSASELEKSFDKAGSSISEKLEKGFAPLMRGGILAAGVTAAATALKEIAKSVAEVDREARKAGVSAKVWQQWTYVAKASGMEIDGVTDALKELNIRGDEFAKTGKGSAQEAFTRLGYTASDVAKRLKDPSAFIDEIIGKLQKMDAAAQTRILDETFGGTGAEQMAKVLGLSVDKIKQLRNEAATFSDEQIESAKKIDAQFETLWRNVTVYAKKAAIESASYAGKIIDAISTLKGDKLIAKYQADATSPEAQMKRLLDERARIANQISEVQANPFNVLKDAELRQLETSLKAVDEQISELGGGSDELKGALAELSAITVNASRSFDTSATSAANFKSALAELKNFLPGLKAEMESLATVNGIEAAYQKTVNNARTMGEVMGATDVRNRALTSAKFGNSANMLDLIASVESGGDYNSTLDNGRWTGGAKNLTGMTLDQVRALQKQMLANPENRALYDGKGSSALGRYQITGTTLEGLIKELGLTGDRKFGEATQDELARALLRRRGNNPAELRKEWTGLKRVDDGTLSSLYGSTPNGAQALDPTPGQQKATELTKQQTEARKQLNQTVQESLSLAQFEQSISSMSAQQQQVELGVFRAKQEAQRAGITLSNDELNAIRAKIEETERLNGVNQQVTKSAEGLGQAQQFFAEGFTSALSGLITGTSTLDSAMQQLANSIINASLQALLLGQGPLAGLLGGGTSSGTGTKAVGGLLGALFSKDGGPVSHSRRTVLHLAGGGDVNGPGGPRGDKIPAMLSDGEFVVNAAATARNRAALEAINSGRAPKLANGGAGGKQIGAGSIGGTVQNVFSPTIPITVQASGNQETDKVMRDRLSKEMDTLLENKMTEFTQKQQRPGNMMARRNFT